MEKKTIDEILSENEFREAECCYNCTRLSYKNANPDPEGDYMADPWCTLTESDTFIEWTCNKFIS